MHRFLIIIEKEADNFSAYAPDLPGCVATGDTQEKVEQNMYQAIEMHLKGLQEDKIPIPKSKAFSEYMMVQ